MLRASSSRVAGRLQPFMPYAQYKGNIEYVISLRPK